MLRSDQKKASKRLLKILLESSVAYLAGEVRTGKTFTALFTVRDFFKANGLRKAKVLFVTGKKNSPDIKAQFKETGLEFKLTIINYESIHKIDFKPDFLILDEAHRLGKFPKPGKIARYIREHFYWIPTILMSGTPSPESYSQLYHQFWVTAMGPWNKYKNFYKWARDYVKIEKMYVGMGQTVNNYSNARKEVVEDFKQYSVSMTQQEAGFKGKVREHFHIVQAPAKITLLLSILKQRGYLDKPKVTSDTAAKMSSHFHQLASGTIIDDDKVPRTISDYKAQFILSEFSEHIAIFYLFKQEGEMLKKLYPNWTNNPEEFNKDESKTFICQVISGKEGIRLHTANCIVFFNISYSAVAYWQARARGLTRDSYCDTHWVFSSTGIEQAVYNAVSHKKDFTTKHFETYVRDNSPKTYKKVAHKDGLHSSQTQSNRSPQYARPYGTKKRPSLVHRGKAARQRSKSFTKEKGRRT